MCDDMVRSMETTYDAISISVKVGCKVRSRRQWSNAAKFHPFVRNSIILTIFRDLHHNIDTCKEILNLIDNILDLRSTYE